MKNLASIVSKSNVIAALDKIMREKPKLKKSTKFTLIYKGQSFPPKEVVRFAALEKGIKPEDLNSYRINGGPPTNSYLQNLGFTIVQHSTTEINELIDKRVARLCWNDCGWVHPTGKSGKSSNQNTHEGRYGYGHEEWLFDVGKIVNGYHYGFLEPVRKRQDAYVGKTFDVWLYSIDAATKRRFWIGEILNLTVIDETEASAVTRIYRKNLWIEEMEAQIRTSGANNKGLSGFKGVDLFNVKFRLVDIKFEGYIDLPVIHPINRISRYSLTHYRTEFDLGNESATSPFAFVPPSNTKHGHSSAYGKKKFIRPPKEIEISNLHREISDNLVNHLRALFGYKNVTPEHPAGYGSKRVDIVVNQKKGLVFYEIKTYASLQTSIREALGQIIEYAYWPNNNKACEIIIVTQVHHDYGEVKLYFQHLRKMFNPPIYFQAFDLSTNSLSDKY